MIDAARDLARQDGGEATDSVTVSFSDRDARVHGVFRLALDPKAQASAFAVLFRDRAPIVAEAAGGLAPEGTDWSSLAAGDLRMQADAPLEGWRLEWRGDGARADLEIAAASAPAEVDDIGGMTGYEQLCRVTGAVNVGSDRLRIDGLGQRDRLWGTPDWRDLALTRSVGVWMGDGDGVALSTARRRGAGGHDEEDVWGALVSGGEPVPVADPRLSTTYDGEGRQRRAGLELWIEAEDPYPRRLAGEALCGSTLDLGPLRLDVAFFSWRAEGREGVGRYDVLRRA